MNIFEIKTASKADQEEILTELRTYNRQFTGKSQPQVINRLIQEKDNIAAGFLSTFTWGSLLIDELWLDPDNPGTSMEEILFYYLFAEAKEKSANAIYTKAIGEKEKNFYCKYGFKEYGSLKDRPPGFVCYYLSIDSQDFPHLNRPDLDKRFQIIHDPLPYLIEKLQKLSESDSDKRLGTFPFWLFGYKAVDRQNKIVGGITGYIGWNWMYVHLLWVKEEHRGHKLGSLLLEEAESMAKSKGIPSSFLGTVDFQAPQFYQKNGYEIFGTRHNFPKGHSTYSLKKSLL